jgi:viroplasmin and RNaseH domain-containing protein
MRFYVVFIGREPGVYDNFMDCHAQVNRFPSNLYKGYSSREEADHVWKLYRREQEQAREQTAVAEALNDKVVKQAAAVLDARNDGSFKMMGCSKDLIFVVLVVAIFVQAYLLWLK